jgi:hypothetical protein
VSLCVGRLTSEMNIRGIRCGGVYWVEIAHECVVWPSLEILDEISYFTKEGKSL